MQIAERVYSLAQEQNDAALMIGANNNLAATLLNLGEFESARQYAGCLGELVIKGSARLMALAKPCSLLGRDSGFIGSRVEETEARTNRKVSEFSKVFVKSA
jgi:hypothetical protein